MGQSTSSGGSSLSSIALADVHAEVSDALQIGDDLEGHRDEAQVRRHRLTGGEDAQRQLVHLTFEAVDAAIHAHRLARQLAVAFGERVDALDNHLLDERPHEEDLVAERAQLLLVDLAGVLASHGPLSAELSGHVVLGPPLLGLVKMRSV